MRWESPYPDFRLHANQTLRIQSYRFYYDNGGPQAGTPIAAQNTAAPLDEQVPCQLRVEIQETAGAGNSNVGFSLQARLDSGSWFTPTFTSNFVRLTTSPHLTHNQPTTNLLTAGTGTFFAGRINSGTGGVDSLTVTASGHTEMVWSFSLLGGIANGASMQFRVVETGGTLFSGIDLATPTITVTKLPPSTSPQLLTATSSNGNSLIVNWATMSEATSGYDLEIENFTTGITIINQSVTKPVTLSNIAIGESRGVRVRGKNSAGVGPWSAQVIGTVTAAPQPPTQAPTGLTVTSQGGNSLVATWNSLSGATGYDVEVDPDGVIIGLQRFSVPSPSQKTVYNNVTSPFTVENLTVGTNLSFRVLARNADGPGPWSAVASGTVTQPPAPPASVGRQWVGTGAGANWIGPSTRPYATGKQYIGRTEEFTQPIIEDWSTYSAGAFVPTTGRWVQWYGITSTTSSIIESAGVRAWRFGDGASYVGMVINHAEYNDGQNLDITYEATPTIYGAESFSAPGFFSWRNAIGSETRYFVKVLANNFQVFRVVENTFTELLSLPFSNPVGTRYKVRVQHVGSELKVWFNDSLLLDVNENVIVSGQSEFRCDLGQADIHYVTLGPIETTQIVQGWVPSYSSPNLTFGAWVATNENAMGYPESYVHLGTTRLQQYELYVQHELQAAHHFEPWGGAGSPSTLNTAEWITPLRQYRAGMIPVLTLMPQVPLSEVVAGQHDSYIDTWATAAAAEGGDIVFRFGHEMNGTWYTWAGNPTEYKAAWQRLYTRTKAIAPNVKFFWCPNIEFAGSGDVADYYPGAEFVDIIGQDGYSFDTPGMTFNEVHLATYQKIVALPGASTKPFWIGETSYPINYANNSAYNQDRYRDYIRSMFDSLANYPQLSMVIWFDENKFENGADTDFSIYTAGAEAQESIRRGLATITNTDPYNF